MTRFLNLRPPYSSVRIASFRKYLTNLVHMLKWPLTMKLNKQQKIMIPFGLKNINIISKNQQIKMVASDMYVVKKVAQHQ